MKDALWKELVRPYYLRYFYFQISSCNCPPSFSACWGFPWKSLTQLSSFPPPAPGGRDIAFLPMADWHGPMQRSQHLAHAFSAAGNRCVYLNLHLGREYPSPYPLSPESRLADLEDFIHELHVHLPREPVYHHRRLVPSEVDRLVAAYARLFSRRSPQAPLVVVSFPTWAPVASELKRLFGYQAVYDCHDYLPAFPGVDPDLAEEEMALLRTADRVFFSSHWLREKWLESVPGLAGRSSVLRNAVTPAEFRNSRASHSASRCHPVTIGYVGAMASWFDVDLVEGLLRARPDWRFVFVGEVVSQEFHRLSRFPNSVFSGQMPYACIPNILSEFSAAIIPFRISPLTLAVNPVKLYEYLCAGLPVVSTPLPEVECFGSSVKIASTAAEFLAALELAVSTDTAEQREIRKMVVASETWQSRAEHFLATVAPATPPSGAVTSYSTCGEAREVRWTQPNDGSASGIRNRGNVPLTRSEHENEWPVAE